MQAGITQGGKGDGLRCLGHRQGLLHRRGRVVASITVLSGTDGGHTGSHDGHRAIGIHGGNRWCASSQS